MTLFNRDVCFPLFRTS